jgi:DNA-binding NarL/FixJ family response regulator
MSSSHQVVIASASPIFARALEQLLESAPEGFRCRIYGDVSPDASLVSVPDVVLLAPHTWEELGAWLPPLRERFPFSPWLVLADFRLPGMFLSALDAQPCALVPWNAAPDRLRASVRALAERRASNLFVELLSLIARHIASRPLRSHVPALSPMEIQCGCAVSLRLTPRQISHALRLGEATVIQEVHGLVRKLELDDPEELGPLVQRALAAEPPSSCWPRTGGASEGHEAAAIPGIAGTRRGASG